ncbi:hypothetical protein AB0J28_50930 [Streptosporangium canum]|uniref:hypothetical protein n=1 Tax=Streptosporangium canum TaxID=324952 RepID=UPI0034373C22
MNARRGLNPRPSGRGARQDYDDYWGPYRSSSHRAKATGWIGVKWDRHQKSNEVHVKGKLYDLDHRTYRQGGKRGYQVAAFR